MVGKFESIYFMGNTILRSILKYIFAIAVCIFYFQTISYLVGNLVVNSAYKLYFPYTNIPKFWDNVLFSFLYFFISCGAYFILKAFGVFKNQKSKYTLSFLVFSFLVIVSGVGYLFSNSMAAVNFVYNIIVTGMAGILIQFIDSKLEDSN